MPTTKDHAKLGRTTYKVSIELDAWDPVEAITEITELVSGREFSTQKAAEQFVTKELPKQQAKHPQHDVRADISEGTYIDTSGTTEGFGYVYDANWEDTGHQAYVHIAATGVVIEWEN